MEIGKRYELKIIDINRHGAILDGDILLPGIELNEDDRKGQVLDVFIYKDSKGRIIASKKKEKISMGQLAVLRVVNVSRIGSFLDWGMDKDLFLPIKEQKRKSKKGDWVLVACSLDLNGRPVASEKVEKYFKKPTGIKENDWLKAVVYSHDPRFGSFVLVEGKYDGLIRNEKLIGLPMPGQEISCRLERIKKDGKLDLSMKSRAYVQLDNDAESIYRMLVGNGEFLRVNDKSRPEDIKMLFGMSKAQFKRAVGRLLKKNLITFKDDGIEAIGGKSE